MCLALIVALPFFTWRPRICDQIPVLSVSVLDVWAAMVSAGTGAREGYGSPGDAQGAWGKHRHAVGAVGALGAMAEGAVKPPRDHPALACGPTGCLSSHPEAHYFYPQKH